MDNSPSNSDDVLDQQIENAENLLKDMLSRNYKPGKIDGSEDFNLEKVFQILKYFTKETECRNGTLNPHNAERIASVASGLTGVKRNGVEYLSHYLVRARIIFSSVRDKAQNLFLI